MTPGEAAGATAVVVGAGFAGVGCAHALAEAGVRVVLVDRRDYHQFQPLLYQVATAMLAPDDVAEPLRTMFRHRPTVDVRTADVVGVDPVARTVTTADGDTYGGDYLVLAAGARARFFHTRGAAEHAFPLYSLDDARRLRTRVFALLDAAERDPGAVPPGGLDLVVVGGGPTGVETAGALADLVHDVVPRHYPHLPAGRVRVHLLDHGQVLLRAFSPEAHAYAADVLRRRGVRLRLGASVEEVTPEGVVLDDGTVVPTRCTIWAGGLSASPLVGASGLPHGADGRVRVRDDLAVDGCPHVFVLGDMARTSGADGAALPQLGAVALQEGRWAAANVLADLAGTPRTPFRYRDKGIMAMVARGDAVAEVGARRHELHGAVACAAWLGVHAWLLSGVRDRVDTLLAWAWDYFAHDREPALADDPDAPRLGCRSRTGG
jgi:NADH:ubiquinone reductase (H+-translocating)